ncbi:hypothetical protein CRE_14362 [Caenorhabditis remanei]|uniref:BTB domain-containing protein n=1 Tax=Caenorhabditis remanei TaxID=31234 RepID=E3NL82_CAERE|nr:hypothetical protein CRE_14362 [Caenorhabditis remanei]
MVIYLCSFQTSFKVSTPNANATMVDGRKRPSRFDYPLDARPGAGPSHRPILAQDSDIEEVPFYKTTPPAYICYVDFTSNADPNLSDLVLVADGRRFYVDKRVLKFFTQELLTCFFLFQNLARHSTMFNAMFFGRFEESRRDEIKVGDVAEKSLQRFLELTVGVHKVLTDENVEEVLALADYWDAQIVKKICEESKTMGIPKKLEGATTGSTNSSNLECTKTSSSPKESTIRQKWNFGFGGSQQLR